jgi:hypothetical protein
MAHRYPFSVINPTSYYGQRVAVYYNLHYHVFSIKAGGKSGLLFSHASCCELTDVTFEVECKGRERAIRQGCKNVHAYVIGTLQRLCWGYSDDMVQCQTTCIKASAIASSAVTYNLHPDHPQFYYKDAPSYIPVTRAKSVILTRNIAVILE